MGCAHLAVPAPSSIQSQGLRLLPHTLSNAGDDCGRVRGGRLTGGLTGGPPLLQVDSPDHRIEKESALVVMPGHQRVPLPCTELPEVILQAITAIVVRIGFNLVLGLGLYPKPKL